MEAENDRRLQELGRVRRGCHGRPHTSTDPLPNSRYLTALQEPVPSCNGSKLAEALSALRLEHAQELRSLLLALREREQYHSERLSRIERHQKSQLSTMTPQLTSLSRQLQRASSKQRQLPCSHQQPWRSKTGRQPPQETESSSSGAKGVRQSRQGRSKHSSTREKLR